MQIDFIALFLIGFLGGFSHCVGMCSGFVFTYTIKIKENDPLNADAGKFKKLLPHLMYNAGRVVTYTLLGELFGLLGGTLGVILAIRNFQGGLQLFAGIIMLLMGLDLLGLLRIGTSGELPGFRLFKGLVNSLFQRVNIRNVFGLGMVLGLIPCGLVYAAGAQAAATQSIFGGMMSMLVFGLGTFPAMILIGLTADMISVRTRTRLYKLAAFLVLLLGLLSVLRGIDALGWIHLFWLP